MKSHSHRNPPFSYKNRVSVVLVPQFFLPTLRPRSVRAPRLKLLAPGRDIESVWSVQVCSTEREARSVFDPEVEGGGWGEDAVLVGGVGDCVAVDITNPAGAGGVQEEHGWAGWLGCHRRR